MCNGRSNSAVVQVADSGQQTKNIDSSCCTVDVFCACTTIIRTASSVGLQFSMHLYLRGVMGSVNVHVVCVVTDDTGCATWHNMK